MSPPEHSTGGQGEPERSAPPPREPTQRLFFALWPDEQERQALARATAKSVRKSGGRPVPAENLHLTLAFLGNVPERRVPELRALALGVSAALAPSAPLALRFARLEHWSQAQLLCALAAEVSASASSAPESRGAARLSAALKDQAAGAGFAPDLKPFRAHVTVARKVLHASAAAALREQVLWRHAAFALVASRTTAAGPAYSVVESFPLGKPEKSPG